MPVTIPDEVLMAAHISEFELRQELALTLFQQERLTLAQASRLAEMGQLAFQALLAARQIPIHYGVEEFREDLRTLRQTDRP
jgi:predicted HTH domain antitoxin